MQYILTLIIICFSIDTSAQPEIFNQSYYDSLKTQKNTKAEKLNNYKQKFRELGLPEKGDIIQQWDNSDVFYHYNIDIDSIDVYKKMGFDLKKFAENRGFSNNYFDMLLTSSVIIIGVALDSTEVIPFSSLARTSFKVKILEVLTGDYYYSNFPDTVKCYFQNYTNVNPFNNTRLRMGVANEAFLETNKKCILFYNRYKINQNEGSILPTDIYDINVFYKPEGGPLVDEKLYNNDIKYFKEIAKEVNKLSMKVWRWKNE